MKPVREWNVWRKQVEETVQRLAGLSADDLPDYDYRSAFEDGEPPARTARAAIRAAREF